MLCVNRAHWLTENEISGLVFDSRYNIIPITEVSELLGIDTKTFDDGVFQFYQTGLVHKVLEATWMEHYNGFPKLTNVEEPLGREDSSYEAKIYCPN